MRDIRIIERIITNLSCAAVNLVTVEEAQALVREIDRTDAFMPLFDPSAYQKIGKNIPNHHQAAEAFLAFRQTLESMRLK